MGYFFHFLSSVPVWWKDWTHVSNILTICFMHISALLSDNSAKWVLVENAHKPSQAKLTFKAAIYFKEDYVVAQ